MKPEEFDLNLGSDFDGFQRAVGVGLAFLLVILALCGAFSIADGASLQGALR